MSHPLAWHQDRRRLLMALLGLLVGLEFLENGMFVFAASHIVGGVDAGPREFAQAQAAYAVGSMVMIVMQQWLSRHFGYRRYLTVSLVIFAIGSVASASADGIVGLGLARLVQGFGGGALFTSSRVLIPMLFGAKERGLAIKYYMLILFGLSACAPVLAASLVDGWGWGWRWIFLSVLPPTALATAGCWWLLPDAAGRGGEPVRWAATPLLMVAAALTLLQLGMAEARYDLFDRPLRLAAIAAAGIALFLFFLWHQWRHEEPLLRLRELRHPVYVMGLALYFVHYLLSNASNYLFPIFAERSLGFPLQAVGWMSTFSAAVSFAIAWGYIKTAAKMPSKKPMMVAGALALAAAAALFSAMPPGADAGALLPGLVAKGMFGVMLVLPVAGLTFRGLGDAAFAHGYQSKNLMRQLAGSFSGAVTAIVLEDRQFANGSQIAATVSDNHAQTVDWMASMQAAFTAHGLLPGAAHQAATAQMSRLVEQQALLLSCEDVYRFLAVLALLAAGMVLAQRRLA
ncbi:MFS transporter [Xylophilus sp. GOD-11R]|uniref:MFS transporter n=1 Tax=Xylophilus sp. GOD-11R TaxID=3089814 RepID=UPI00298D4BD7|nr:MFS transporter [Xylophilus sp. GOD-11R]WPB58586.1 MFS transporter [Xylophilus sp. GOD-11R]